MGGWMVLEREFKVGDVVICIEESDLPDFVGTRWIVQKVGSKNLYYCMNKELFHREEGFPFTDKEITLSSSLIEELL